MVKRPAVVKRPAAVAKRPAAAADTEPSKKDRCLYLADSTHADLWNTYGKMLSTLPEEAHPHEKTYGYHSYTVRKAGKSACIQVLLKSQTFYVVPVPGSVTTPYKKDKFDGVRVMFKDDAENMWTTAVHIAKW